MVRVSTEPGTDLKGEITVNCVADMRPGFISTGLKRHGMGQAFHSYER